MNYATIREQSSSVIALESVTYKDNAEAEIQTLLRYYERMNGAGRVKSARYLADRERERDSMRDERSISPVGEPESSLTAAFKNGHTELRSLPSCNLSFPSYCNQRHLSLAFERLSI